MSSARNWVRRQRGRPFRVERTPVGEFKADLLDAWQRDGIPRLDPGLKAHGDGARVVAGKRPRRNAAPQVDDQALGLRALGVDRHCEDADGDRKRAQDEGSRPALSTRQTPGRTKGSLGRSAWQLEHPCDLGLPTREGGHRVHVSAAGGPPPGRGGSYARSCGCRAPCASFLFPQAVFVGTRRVTFRPFWPVITIFETAGAPQRSRVLTM